MVKSTILAAAAVAATSVSALNTFRHRHDRKAILAPHPPSPHQLEVRAVTYLHTETDVVTEWTTVYVTVGDEPTSTAAENPTPSSSLTFVTAARPSSPSVEEPATTTTSPTSTTPKVEPTTTTNVVAQKAAAPAAGGQTTTSAYAEPSTTTTSAAAASSATGSGSSSSSSSTSKRGLAYNSAAIAKTFVSTSSFSWGYDWGCTTGTESSLGVEYVPMLWGNKDNMVSLWSACAQSNIDAGATHLLSFNEPDGTTDAANQAQMSPSEAANLHIAHMNPFSGKAKIGAPAITSDNTTSVLTSVHWLDAFFSACNAAGGCAVDFCPVHWYGSIDRSVAQTVQDLNNFLTTASGYCNGKPLWLTEYALQGASDSDTAEFIASSIKMLDSFSGLDRYSYFFVDGALSTSGSINSLGKSYASA